jgi:hypothetical protein
LGENSPNLVTLLAAQIRSKKKGIAKSKKEFSERTQGCQMAYFQPPKNPNLGKFCIDSQWKMSVYFIAFWFVLWPFVIFSGYLVFFPVLLCRTKKNLATLDRRERERERDLRKKMLTGFFLLQEKKKTLKNIHC